MKTTTMHKRIDDAPTIVGCITPDHPGGRRGRKSKLELADAPYTVAARSDTSRYFMSFTGTHPDTGESGRWKISLVPPGERMATQDQAEAERLAAAVWLRAVQKDAERRRGEVYLGPKSVPALAVRYCEFLKADATRSPNGLAAMRQAIERLLEYTCLGSEPDVTSITPKTVRRVRDELRGSTFRPVPRIPRPHRPSGNQVAYILRNLMYFLEWVKQEHIPKLENVVHASGVLNKMARPRRDELHFHTPIEVASILRTALALPPRLKSLGNAEILHIDFYLGNRSVEALLLRPCDVDFDTGVIHLVIAKQNRYVDGHREWFEVKTPADVDRLTRRPVKMWPKLRAVLWAYASRHRIYEDKWPWFFPQSGAKHFDPANPSTHRRREKGPYCYLQSVIRHTSKELPGLTYKGFHVARHTYISARRHQYMPVFDPHTGLTQPVPVSLTQIQSEVGHADGSAVTMKVYNKVCYHIPPNTLYELDWDALAALCRQAAASEASTRRNGVPAALALRYAPVASHPQLQSMLAEVPVAR